MKHLFIFLFLIGLGLIACNSSDKGDAIQGDFDLSGYESTKVTSGITHVLKKDEKEMLLEEGFIKGGKKFGQWITYDASNGKITGISSFIDGQLNGYSFVVSSRGYLDEQAGYINNVLDGKLYKYRYGRPNSESHFKNGKLDGLQKEYYDNGKLQQETEFKDGVQNSIYNYYSDDGILRMSYKYKDGEKVEGGMVEVEEEKPQSE